MRSPLRAGTRGASLRGTQRCCVWFSRVFRLLAWVLAKKSLCASCCWSLGACGSSSWCCSTTCRPRPNARTPCAAFAESICQRRSTADRATSTGTQSTCSSFGEREFSVDLSLFGKRNSNVRRICCVMRWSSNIDVTSSISRRIY